MLNQKLRQFFPLGFWAHRTRNVAVGLACLFSIASASGGERLKLAPGESNGSKVTPRGPGLTTQDLNAGQTPADLVNTLLGPGVSVTNVQYNGVNIAAGTFAGGTGIIGFESGIVLSSGDIAFVPGPNTLDWTSANNGFAGDADLNALIPGYITYDATVLEFDFECSGTQIIAFRYVLTSEEYNEWVNTPYNDVFGFFLNGVNIAEVPGSNGLASSINNINCDNPYNPPLGSFCNLYINNDCDDIPPGGFPCAGARDTEMDGLTVVLTAAGTLQPGLNHIKLAVADAGDEVYDTNVYIEGQSFTCGTPLGACCHNDSQSCTDYVTQEVCSGAADVWSLGLLCNQLDPPCAPVVPQGGEDCEHTVAINTLPHVEVNSTCTMDNDYSNTCLGTYDNGDDILYELNLVDPQTVTITVDGITSLDNWIGLALADTCPPDLSCIDFATTSGDVATIGPLSLSAGTYFLMVDNWPSEDECLNYTLTIATDAPVKGACCENGFCTDLGTEGDCAVAEGIYHGDSTVCTVDMCPPHHCPGDANGDDTVDPLDSGFVQARFGCIVGSGNAECDEADVNGDGLVDPLDVGYVLARFGICPPSSAATISGEVVYEGSQVGTIYISAMATNEYTATLAVPGAFSMEIWIAGEYSLTAFMDTNGNASQDTGEPFGIAAGNPYAVLDAGTVVENVVIDMNTHAISGSVKYPSGSPASGVTLTAVGPVTKTALTSGDGTYSVGDLPDGFYTVTPTHATRYFYPYNAEASVIGSNVPGVNFEAHNLPPGEVDGMSKGIVQAVNPEAYSVTIDEDGTLTTVFVYADTQYFGTATNLEQIQVGWDIEAEFWTSPLNLATVITSDPQ